MLAIPYSSYDTFSKEVVQCEISEQEQEPEEEPRPKYQHIGIQANPCRRNARTQVTPKMSCKSECNIMIY